MFLELHNLHMERSRLLSANMAAIYTAWVDTARPSHLRFFNWRYRSRLPRRSFKREQVAATVVWRQNEAIASYSDRGGEGTRQLIPLCATTGTNPQTVIECDHWNESANCQNKLPVVESRVT